MFKFLLRFHLILELEEEAKITAVNHKKRGIIKFEFLENTEEFLEVHVYTSTKFEGIAKVNLSIIYKE